MKRSIFLASLGFLLALMLCVALFCPRLQTTQYTPAGTAALRLGMEDIR